MLSSQKRMFDVLNLRVLSNHFNAVQGTCLKYLKRTFCIFVYTSSVVLSDVFNGEQFKAAALSINASVLLNSDDVFQSYIPGL